MTPKPVQFHHPHCSAKGVLRSLVTYTLIYRAGYTWKQVMDVCPYKDSSQFTFFYECYLYLILQFTLILY